MTKKLILFVLGVLLVLVSAFTTAQDEDAPFGLIIADNTIVRVGPDFAYPIREQLAIDTSVIILGRAGLFSQQFDGRQWLQVQYNDRTGWVLARVVRTGRPFNRLPLLGLNLPRNQDRRVPPEFDLATHICDRWQGQFGQSGDYMQGDQEMTFTFPVMPGAVNYSFVAEAPSGLRRTLDIQEPFITVPLSRLNLEGGVYKWYIIPYWNETSNPRTAQQLCIRREGGTFEKPDTTPVTATPTATPSSGS